MHTIDWENTDVPQTFSEEDRNAPTCLDLVVLWREKEWKMHHNFVLLSALNKMIIFYIFPYSLAW